MVVAFVENRGATFSRKREKGSARALLALLCLFAAPAAFAQSSDDSGSTEVRKYCTNIARAASEARFAWQTARLNDLETRIKGRIQDLDARTAALRGWIAKREDIEKKAAEKLVGIYAKMRPETAATQISMLDDEMAAAVLGQLNPRQASAIFNEIAPERAGKLAGLIAGVAPADDKTPAPTKTAPPEKTAAAEKQP